jgi:hypothetical protein
VGGPSAEGIQARKPDGFIGGLFRFPIPAELHQELSALDQEGGLAEALERRDAAEFSLGADRCPELVKIDGLRAGDHDQVDEVLDARVPQLCSALIGESGV